MGIDFCPQVPQTQMHLGLKSLRSCGELEGIQWTGLKGKEPRTNTQDLKMSMGSRSLGYRCKAVPTQLETYSDTPHSSSAVRHTRWSSQQPQPWQIWL